MMTIEERNLRIDELIKNGQLGISANADEFERIASNLKNSIAATKSIRVGCSGRKSAIQNITTITPETLAEMHTNIEKTKNFKLSD